MKFEIVGKDFLINGEPTKIVSGAVHYFRNLPDTWDDIFAKLVALGCNCVETYCVWNMILPESWMCVPSWKKPRLTAFMPLCVPARIFALSGNLVVCPGGCRTFQIWRFAAGIKPICSAFLPTWKDFLTR